MQIPSLNGLEMLENVRVGSFPAPAMAATIPMKIEWAKKGAVKFSAVASDQHLNPMGGVHGGFAATVLDSATGCAIHSMLAAGESYSTIELNVKMLKAVPRDTPLYAVGKLIHISKRLGISEASLKDADGVIYAHATATCMIFRKKAQSIQITPTSPGRPSDEVALDQ